MAGSWDILIDGEPYLFEAQGIVLGNALAEPGEQFGSLHQIGSAVIEDVITGIGPRVNRGNGYYNINRLIPTVEGQLILNPTVDVGAQYVLPGGSEYTPGIHHHPSSGGQYIAYGKAIYLIRLADLATLTYTATTGSDPTSINAFARYTGGAFNWRNRTYFGIENSLNGQALGYAWVDASAPTVVTVVTDLVKGFSFAASGRGRVFLAANQAKPPGTEGIPLYWSPSMGSDYSDSTFTLYGSTGSFIYGIENSPRVTWVGMIGSAALFFLADGSVLSSDEAGFLGMISSRAQASAAEDNFQGFGAVPYLDGMAFRVGFGGPHHVNPVTLLTKSLSVGNVQDVPLDVHDITINCMTSIGEHLLMAGDKYLYDIVWTKNAPVIHKLLDLSSYAAAGFLAGDMTYQGGLLVITMVNKTIARFQQIQTEPIPAINVSTEVYAGAARTGWMDTGLLMGPDRTASMTKFWLQVRGAHFQRVDAGNSISFSNALVDEQKAVTIAPVTTPGPWASSLSGNPQVNRFGRTLSFRMNLNAVAYTGFNERVYTPIIADFVWCPNNEDSITLTIRATSEQLMRSGGLLSSRSSRQVVDALHAKMYQVITVQFSDGSPTPQTWTMFVEVVETKRGVESDSSYGADSYVVTMVCRRLS